MNRAFAAAIALSTLVLAAIYTSSPSDACNKSGNGNGKGKGGGGPCTTTGGSGPLPLIGVTALGQAVGAGGLYLLWRRRRKKT